MKLLIAILLFLFSKEIYSAQGFRPSYERNVVMLKGKTSGGTAFIFNDHAKGPLIITQQHVIEGHNRMTLQWGHKVGPIFFLGAFEEGAYKSQIDINPLWKDSQMDIAVMKAPSDVVKNCRCVGFEAGSFRVGPAELVGYPITARRIWPSTNKFLWMWRELWATVVQQKSIGLVWKEGEEYLSDIDAISGNSGGPVLQDGRVIGVIHLLKTWKGEGYRYKNPSFNFIPFHRFKTELSTLRK